MKLIFTLFAILIFYTVPCAAQYTLFQYDIDPRPGKDATPAHFTPLKNKVYFAAFDSLGMELWGNDGTNVKMVADIWPGSRSGMGYAFSQMLSDNNKLYFVAGDSSTGQEIFQYDGNNPPSILTDLDAGPGSAEPDLYMIYNNKLYFSATNGTARFLFEYDLAGNKVKKVHTCTTDKYGDSYCTVLNNKIYFITEDPSPNKTLGVYDPSSGNTTIIPVSQLTGGNTLTSISSLYAINGNLYFIANQGAGASLYEYDGNNQANVINALIGAGYYCMGTYKPFIYMNGKIYFTANKGFDVNLYGYDPANNTVKTEISKPGGGDYFIQFGNKVIYGSATNTYVYDFSSPHAEFKTLNNGILTNSAYNATVIGNKLYFANELNYDAGTKTYYNIELCVLQDTTLSASNISSNIKAIAAYPNPVTQDAHLSISLKDATTFTIQLIDLNGRVVYSQQPQVYSAGKHTLNIPMQQLQAGMYFYRIDDNTGQLLGSGKLMKQ